MSSNTRDDKEQNKGSWSKKRKQQANMKDNSPSHGKTYPKVEWTQGGENLTMTLKLEGLKNDQLKNIDVRFTDSDVTIILTDGRQWTWNFSGEIIGQESRAQVKKQKLTLHMKKKVPEEWDSFELSTVPKPSIQVTDEIKEPKIVQDAESMDSGIVAPASSPSNNTSTEEKSESTPTAQTDVDSMANVEEKIEKEEEPLYKLSHVKHDYIEKDDTFIVHLYVKGANKDAVKILFHRQRFIVKFQTSDPKFLKLHEGTTEETAFCWDINLKGEIYPEKSKYKINQTLIELTLIKVKFERWKDLEALQRKVQDPPAAAAAKTDWISINQVKTRESTEDTGAADTATSLPQPAVDKVPSSRSEQTESGKEESETDEKPSCSDSTALGSSNKDNLAQQKPTCKVQPLNKNSVLSNQVVTPGFTGLDNLGNTCFMNSVLQCLANTRELRDFFKDTNMLANEINLDNPLGSGGRLAQAFAFLMNTLWSGKHYSFATSKLKSLVAQKASQFTGFAQHDAQEFMAFLLDGLHEDLNRIKKKPYTETVEDEGRPDEVVAAEAWAVHKKRNDSFIVDQFQGQYKSKLVCPVCGKVSITFDPFLYLSLPLPKRQRLLPVTFMWRDPYRKPVRYMLRLSKDATVEALKDCLQKKTEVDPKNIRVFEAYNGRIHKLFSPGSDLSIVQASDTLIASEVLSEEIAGEPVHEVAVIQRTAMPNQFPARCSSCRKLCPEGSKLRRCSKCFKAGYCDSQCQKNHWAMHRSSCKPTPEPVGCPFILSVPESRATFARICQLLEAYARYSVDVFQPPVKTDMASKLSSQVSSSSLSTSSQSSGSLNSLDSQSSFSSTCTITADQDQDQNLDDLSADDASGEPVVMEDIVSGVRSEGGSDSGISTATSKTSLCVSEKIGNGSGESSAPGVEAASQGQFPKGQGPDEVDGSKVNKRVVETASSLAEDRKSSTASANDKVASESSPLVNPVLGIQTSDSDRTMPMFHIKPVNQDGIGLTGADGERLEDKGDVPLDLTNRFFISMDWKNNDKLSAYVLVQSKGMDFDNDTSMMTASLEENNNVTLDQCLELFTEPETLSREEAWYCPQCKAHREASKQLSTWKLPHTLIIQLKRFSFRNFIWRDKIDKMVEYPIRGLDLSSYYGGARPSNEPPPIYDVYGVVNHHGGILGGHYTAYVRCADLSDPNRNEVGWRLCDDSRVVSISHEKNVLTRAAYLLFYRRREQYVPKPSAGLSTVDTDLKEKYRPTPQSQSVDNRDLEEEEEVAVSNKVIEEQHVVESTSKVTERQFESVYQEDNSFSASSTQTEDLGYTDMDSVD